ncbi:MAG TPA: Ig-like domain-containing protein [Caulobacter sp.]|nr:Ig-like domain-containing protein [Caulobacter sp.]
MATALASLAAAGLASSSSAQVTTSYTYDDQGQVKTVVRSGNTVTYGYDAAGNRTAVGVSYPPPGSAVGSMSVPFGGSASLALPVSGQVTGAALDAAPAKGSVAISGTTATYTAGANSYGADSFTYHAVGPGGNSPVQTISVSIGNPPAPGANNGTLNVAYNSAASLAAPVTGVATGLVIDSNPAKGTVSASGTTLTYTATWPNYGADSFTYHATGPGGPSPTRTISVNIANGAAPAASNGSASTGYNAPVTITYPIGGDYAVGALDSQPAHGSVSTPTYVNGVGAQSTYTPQAGWIGADSWTFHGTSPFGNSPVRTFTVTTGAPAAPTVANTSLTATYNGSGAVSLPVSGVYTSIGFPNGPAHGALSLSGATVTYTPTAGYYGADSFTYNATGPGGTSNTGTVYVTVPRPPPPTVSNISVQTTWGVQANITPSISGYYDSFAIATAPTRGGAGVVGGQIVYNNMPGYTGLDSFTYTASGVGGVSAPATITVDVVAPAPVTASDVSANVAYNTAANITLATTGPVYSTSIYAQPAHGTVALHGGYVTYLPTSGYSGADSFQYSVSNGVNSTAMATVYVNVAAPPAAPQPTPQPDSALVHSQNTIVISPLANDSDPSGYPLTITSVSSNGGGSWTIINGGTQINFQAPTVATRGNKTVTLTYTVSNGHGGVASSTISVVVETEYYD